MRRMRNGEEREVPFFVVPRQLDLCNGADDLDGLVAAIRDACGEDAPILIVIDTVSRVMAGGNENSPEDMGALIASADRLRDEFGANACLVHHVGKDASRGSRGHSSLYAAIDTAVEVTRDENAKMSTATVIKQRDGGIGEKIHFTLDVVRLGENEETGEEVTSCVAAAPDPAQVAEARRTKPKLGKAEQIALNALEIAVETDGEAPPAAANCPAERWVREEAWRKRCYRNGISHGEERARQVAFQRAANALEMERRVGIQDGFAWLER
jgi:hypothetical protein